MFFRVGRRDGDDRVPVVRRGDHHGVNVLASNQSPEIVIGRAALVGAAFGLFGVVILDRLLRVLAAMSIDIAHGDGVCFLLAEEPSQQAGVLLPHANETERDAVVRLHFRGPDVRRQNEWGHAGGGGGGFEKRASGQIFGSSHFVLIHLFKSVGKRLLASGRLTPPPPDRGPSRPAADYPV